MGKKKRESSWADLKANLQNGRQEDRQKNFLVAPMVVEAGAFRSERSNNETARSTLDLPAKKGSSQGLLGGVGGGTI